MDDEGCMKAIPHALDVYAYKALHASRQLQVWREKGYSPQLYSHVDGWVLKLDNADHAYDVDVKPMKSALRYTTEVCPSIEAAVEAALKVLQP